MQTQASGRTPSSILRKRADKENEAKDAKRSKMRGRRVSFAPDPELETMHLFHKDVRQQSEDMQLTDDITNGIAQAMPWNLSGLQPEPAPAKAVVQPTNAAASPGMSPLSMDLTNNSVEFQQAYNRQPHTSLQQLQPAARGAHEYTHNITQNVPGLSTLVEEDEEANFDASEGPVSMPTDARRERNMQQVFPDSSYQSPGPAMSPASPFVLREMQRSAGSMGQVADDTEDLKDKWGFTPGADDTLDVSHGRMVMGDTTYNHVYGNATTGDITKAMKAAQVDGAGPSTSGVQNVLALIGNASTSAAPQASIRPNEPHEFPGFNLPPAHQPALQAMHQTPAHARIAQHQTEMTIRLLEDDNQTEAWRQPLMAQTALTTGRASVASNRLTMDVPTRGAGETTNLLANTTRFGAGATTGGYTAQLLADNTTRGALEQFMQSMHQDRGVQGMKQGGQPRDVDARDQLTHRAGSGGLLADATAASSSMGAAMRGMPQMMPSQGGQQTAQQKQQAAISPNLNNTAELDFGTNMGGLANNNSGNLLEEQNLTLDDFALPPEPSLTNLGLGAAHAAINPSQEAPGRFTHMSQSSLGSQPLPLSSQPGSQPSWGGGRTGSVPMELFSQPLASTQDLSIQHSGMKAGGYGSMQWPDSQPGLGQIGSQQMLASQQVPGSQHILGSQQYALGHPLEDAGRFMTNSQEQLAAAYRQQQQRASLDRVLPPISLQEFLQIVEVRFLDDMRRRTSLMQHPVLEAQSEPAPKTLVEALDARYVAGARMHLSHSTIEELATRVEAMQARMGEAEAAFAKANPGVFQLVQLSSGTDLDRIRDQMKLLKRLCRQRTMMAWKQQRIEYEQLLSAAYRDSMQSLHQDTETIKRNLVKATNLEHIINQTHSQIIQQVQQDQAQEKEAQAQKEQLVFQRQRLAEVQAQNEQRQDRAEEAEKRRGELQTRYEEVLQRKAELQKQLQQLRGEGIVSVTPSKATPAGQAIEKLQQKQEQLDVMMGLQSLQLDARAASSSRLFCLTAHGAFRVLVKLPDQSPGGDVGSGTCSMEVQLVQGALGSSEGARVLIPYLEGTCVQLTRTMPVSGLSRALQHTLLELGRLSVLLGQLNQLLLSWPLLSRLSLTEQKELVLWFINADACTKVSVSIPCEALKHMHSAKPELRVQVHLPAAKAPQMTADMGRVLSEVVPGPMYLQHVCYITSQLMAATTAPSCTSTPSRGQQPLDRVIEVAISAARTPLRMYDNPLFGPAMAQI